MSDPTPPTTPTPAAAWRRQQTDGELFRLPGCGHVARLRRPSLTALAATSNGVPNALAAAVLRLLAAPPAKTDDERVGNVKRNSQGYLEVAALCLVEPRLQLKGEPGEGEIGPQDLSDLDYAWIYHTFVEGAATESAIFRLDEGA